MKYSLDSNAVIALLKLNPALLGWMGQHHASDFGLSSIAAYELYFGAFKSRQKARVLQDLQQLPFAVLDFDREDSRRAGQVRAWLEGRGTPIGSYDTLIAGQALARDLTLVTRNTREFQRVPGLRVVDWEA